jgi:NADPH:quinone reductase-like Zn-dependent oxidoreductase
MLSDKMSSGILKAAIAGTYSLEDFSLAFKHAELSGEERNGKIIFQPNKF